MNDSDKGAFAALISGVYAYHRTAISANIIEVYWRGCQRWSMEQVTRAIDALTLDAEAGRFVPKLGDMARILEGTHTDRSQIAWGKTLEAMQSIGAYTDVIFDDPAIHAVVEDLGGWPKLCRTDLKELGYTQHRFCESHRAYTGRGTFDYPCRLGGERASDGEYAKKGLPPPKPALIGDEARCALVYGKGMSGGKTAIAFKSMDALMAILPVNRESDQDPKFLLESNSK